MNKIDNFGITEDDINWRTKDNYIIECDDNESCNRYRGVGDGSGTVSGRGGSDGECYFHIDLEGINIIRGLGCGFGSGSGHSYHCHLENGEGSGAGSADGSGNKNGICVA